MRPLAITKLALTGFGLRDFLRAHKKAAWLIAVIVILNEIRGLAVVYGVLRVVLP